MTADRTGSPWWRRLSPGLTLALFVAAGLTAVTAVHQWARPHIAEAERQAVLARLEQVLPPGYDNDPPADAFVRPAPLAGAPPMTVYPAYRDGRPLGVAVEVETPRGYAGPIRLLVGIDAAGRVVAVRVAAHRETPGLGDVIDTRRSRWMDGFTGRTIGDPPAAAWRLTVDGGAFDAVTGATVTTRAVVEAVREVLVDFHRAETVAPNDPR